MYVRRLIIVLVALSLMLSIGQSAMASKYHRKAVTAVESIARITAGITLSEQQDSLLHAALKNHIMMARYDAVPLPNNIQDQLRSKLGNKVITMDQLKKVINDIAAPSLEAIMKTTAKLRAEVDNPNFDRVNFITKSVKDLGITSDDLERMVKCGYLFVPYLTEFKTTGQGEKTRVSLKGGAFWYHLQFEGEKGKLVQVASISSKGSAGSGIKKSLPTWAKGIINKLPTQQTSLSPELNAFWNAANQLSENISIKTRDAVLELAMAGMISRMENGRPRFRLGSREDLVIDDRYSVIDFYEDEFGKTHEDRIGHLMVTKVADNRKDLKQLSWGRGIIGGGHMYEGMELREIPKAGMDIAFKTGWRSLKLDSLLVKNTSKTYFGINEDTSLVGIFTLDADLQMNIGRKLGVSQFFACVGAGIGYVPVNLLVLDSTELNHGQAFSYHFGVLKRMYFGRIAFVLGGDMAFNKLWFTRKVDNVKYSLSTSFRSGVIRGGFDFALSASLNLGLRGGYIFADKGADWKFEIDNTEQSWFTGNRITVDHDGAYASLAVSYALPSFGWSPF